MSLSLLSRAGWLMGSPQATLRAWPRCAERAVELAIPYEEGRARLEVAELSQACYP